jgi:hypothetical protein
MILVAAVLVAAFLAIWVAPRAVTYTISCAGSMSQQACDGLAPQMLEDARKHGHMPPLFLPVLHIRVDPIWHEGCPLSYWIEWAGGSSGPSIDLGLGGCPP